jgi:hypothetical protein
MRIYLSGESMVAQLVQTTRKMSLDVHKRMAGAMRQAEKAILVQGRQDIQEAGNFGARWTEGLTSEIDDQETSITLTVKHEVPYWSVFQTGKLIRGKPLLWIPLPGVDPNERGDFFQTSKKGNLLLFKRDGRDITPLRVAKEEVYIPKKFHLVEICRDVAGTLGQLYKLYQAGA